MFSIKKRSKRLNRKAVNADKCEDDDNAFTYYSKAAENLNYIRKYDENSYNKELYTKKQLNI